MTVNYTTLLGLAKPVSGTESGTWGDTVNTNLTDYLDDAIAGAQIISGTLTAVTLSKTTGTTLSQAGPGATGSSQYQIIRCTGAPSSLLTITAPAADKTYIIINATSTFQSVKIVGVGPTPTGVTILSGKTSLVVWNVTDFVEVSPNTISGTLPVANGGTGATTLTGVLKGNGTSAFTAASSGTDYSAGTSALATGILKSTTSTGALTIAVAGDFPTLNQSTTGTATTATNLASGSVGTIPYQSASGTTAMLAAGTSGNVLTCNGAAAPTWSPASVGGTATGAGYTNPTAAGTIATAFGSGASSSGFASMALGWGADASGSKATAIGASAYAPSVDSIGIGSSASSTGNYATAIGYSPSAQATLSTAIGASSGYQGSVTATGAGAMALGGSYASGVDSFAAAIANNTSSYGATGSGSAIAMGFQAKATSISTYTGIALGSVAYQNNIYGGIAIGYHPLASGSQATAIGYYAIASGDNSISFGGANSSATGYLSVVLGGYGGVAAQTGKYVFGSYAMSTNGDAQDGKIVLRATTTTTTAVVLTSDGGAASTTNQLIVASSQAMAIQGTLIAKVAGTGEMAGWNITGIVSNNFGTMAVSGLALTAIGTDSIGLGTAPTIAVDNTNKGVTITSGYKSATTIKWVATVNTSEVTCS